MSVIPKIPFGAGFARDRSLKSNPRHDFAAFRGGAAAAHPHQRRLVAGGAQTHVTLLCALLREAGAEVTVAAAATNWTPEAVAGLRASGVRVVRLALRLRALACAGQAVVRGRLAAPAAPRL
ncbi:MAG: hypothetical protein WDO13_19320 [Verrucomicrobiota bacterium]